MHGLGCRRSAAAGRVILVAALVALSLAQSPPPAEVSLHIDTRQTLRTINPLIYGVSQAGPDDLVATGARVNRWGGNPNTPLQLDSGLSLERRARLGVSQLRRRASGPLSKRRHLYRHEPLSRRANA